MDYPHCLGGGKKIIPTGTGDVFGFKGYQAMLIRNNEFHNYTECITVDGYHPNHQNLKVPLGENQPEKVHKLLLNIDGVYDVVETNQSQEQGKYFFITERRKRQQVERAIHEILHALSLRITDITDEGAEKYFDQCPSLRSRLSQGGYTTKAAEFNKDIFDTDTLSKTFAGTPFFEMDIQLGTDDVLDAAPPVLTRNA